MLVRALRDAGFEVVYTGLFQTPEMIASAALQEDVQVIGLSILSGAHMALFPRIMDELRERGLDDVLVVAGGTIPKADIPRIKALGVAEVFGPGTRLADDRRLHPRERPSAIAIVVTADDVLLRIQGSDRRALPRLATLVENEDPRGLEALDALFPLTGQAHVVGVTGPPGAGKSTLMAALLGHIRAAGRRVAVLAVDPSSPISGGAVLGDRIRMMDRHADDGVFVRSMASRGRQGGLAWATAGLVHLLDAAGYPLILVETVGTGQDGTDIASLADTVVVVEAPGLGDGVQAIKSGLLEVGDIVVVNKADQPGAEDAQRLLRASFDLAHPSHGRSVPILPTVGITGSGMSELLAAIDDHAAWLD